jgi:hypothetical protein
MGVQHVKPGGSGSAGRDPVLQISGILRAPEHGEMRDQMRMGHNPPNLRATVVHDRIIPDL